MTLLLPLLHACAPEPVVIEARLPVHLFGTGPHAVATEVLAADGTTLDRPALRYEAIPADAVQVDGEGRVTCLRSYDGVVTVRVGELSRVLIARCRMVADVRPEKLTMPLVSPASEYGGGLSFRAYDAGGTALGDVPVTLTPGDPTRAVIDGSRVRGLRAGDVTVHAGAGAFHTEVVLHVIVPTIVHVSLPHRRPDGSPWEPQGLPDPMVRVGEASTRCWNTWECALPFDATSTEGPFVVEIVDVDASSEPADLPQPTRGPPIRGTRLLPDAPDLAEDDPIGVGPCLPDQPCTVGGAEVWIRKAR